MMKKRKKTSILIVVILIIVGSILCVIGWYFKKEDDQRKLELERKTVLELSHREMKSYGYDFKEYDVVIEHQNEDGTYDVRLRKNHQATSIYYHVNPKNKRVSMGMEKTFPENKQGK